MGRFGRVAGGLRSGFEAEFDADPAEDFLGAGGVEAEPVGEMADGDAIDIVERAFGGGDSEDGADGPLGLLYEDVELCLVEVVVGAGAVQDFSQRAVDASAVGQSAEEWCIAAADFTIKTHDAACCRQKFLIRNGHDRYDLQRFRCWNRAEWIAQTVQYRP